MGTQKKIPPSQVLSTPAIVYFNRFSIYVLLRGAGDGTAYYAAVGEGDRRPGSEAETRPVQDEQETEHFNLGHYLYARVFVCASRRKAA